MDLGFIGFTQGIAMVESGVMGRAMVLERRPVQMGAVMLGNSSAASSTDWVATISGNCLDFSFSLLLPVFDSICIEVVRLCLNCWCILTSVVLLLILGCFLDDPD